MATARRRALSVGTVAALLLAGCASAPTPAVREELARLRRELTRLDEAVARTRTDQPANREQLDRRTAHALGEIQRTLADLTVRLDRLGLETGELRGRLDEVRRRLARLALEASPSAEQPPATAPAEAEAPDAAPDRPAMPEARRPSSPAEATASPGDAVERYRAAYVDYTRGNYALAISGFQTIVRQYPGADLAEQAQYWIAESHFSLARDFRERGEVERAREELERAVLEFRQLVRRYPRGDRAPSALFRRALALLELDQPVLAKIDLRDLVERFPGTEEALRAREELARLEAR